MTTDQPLPPPEDPTLRSRRTVSKRRRPEAVDFREPWEYADAALEQAQERYESDWHNEGRRE